MKGQKRRDEPHVLVPVYAEPCLCDVLGDELNIVGPGSGDEMSFEEFLPEPQLPSHFGDREQLVRLRCETLWSRASARHAEKPTTRRGNAMYT